MSLMIGFVVLVPFISAISFIPVQNKEKVLQRPFRVSDTDLTDVKDSAQHLFLNAWHRQFSDAQQNF